MIDHAGSAERLSGVLAAGAAAPALADTASWSALSACTPLTPPLTQPPAGASFDTIAFGSCAQQDQPQPIWDAVTASQPDLFVFLGDNIYGDTQDMDTLRAKYAQLAAKPGYQRLQANTQVVATWDDHDYGANDVGAEYPQKEASKQIFLDFFGEPADSERRMRDGGVYTSYFYGPPERRVQVILLDTRWDRSPLERVSAAEYEERKKVYAGPYTAATDPGARMLGEDQWRWLAEQLRQPAALRLVATSTPFLQDGTGWETWANFPAERARLIDLIEETKANGVIFITGDTHRAQFSRGDGGGALPAVGGGLQRADRKLEVGGARQEPGRRVLRRRQLRPHPHRLERAGPGHHDGDSRRRRRIGDAELDRTE